MQTRSSWPSASQSVQSTVGFLKGVPKAHWGNAIRRARARRSRRFSGSHSQKREAAGFSIENRVFAWWQASSTLRVKRAASSPPAGSRELLQRARLHRVHGVPKCTSQMRRDWVQDMMARWMAGTDKSNHSPCVSSHGAATRSQLAHKAPVSRPHPDYSSKNARSARRAA